jgi:hypothetical protein
MPSFCNNCGAVLERSARFCGACGAQIMSPSPNAVSIVTPKEKRSFFSLGLLLGVVIAVGLASFYFFLIRGRSASSVLTGGAPVDVIGNWSVSGGDLVGEMADMGLKVVSVDSGGALHGEWELRKGLTRLPVTGILDGNHLSLEAPMNVVTIRVEGTVNADTLSGEYAQIMSGASQPFFSRRITMRRSVPGHKTSNGTSPPPEH